MKKCLRCQSLVPDESTECPNCGHDLVYQQQQLVKAYEQRRQAQQDMESGLRAAKVGAGLSLVGYILIMLPVVACILFVLWLVLSTL